jgi:hypothetical protein
MGIGKACGSSEHQHGASLFSRTHAFEQPHAGQVAPPLRLEVLMDFSSSWPRPSYRFSSLAHSLQQAAQLGVGLPAPGDARVQTMRLGDLLHAQPKAKPQDNDLAAPVASR